MKKITGFREKADLGINAFVEYYSLDFYNILEQSTEGTLKISFQAFRLQKRDQKIYVLIDKYDHFANESLGEFVIHFFIILMFINR